MKVAEEAGAALSSVWETMVVLAEAGNDLVVNKQRLAPARGARQIAQMRRICPRSHTQQKYWLGCASHDRVDRL